MKVSEGTRSYHKVKNSLFFFNIILDGVLLFAFFLSGLSVGLKEYCLGISEVSIIVNGWYIIIFGLVFSLIHLPLSWFLGYYWEHKYGLSTQSLALWIKDEGIKTILSLILMFVLVEMIYIFLGEFPNSWWLWAGGFWLLISFILAKLTPQWIIPLFFKYSSIDNEGLREKIKKLFSQCQVSVNDIYSINLSSKTKKANAFVCGLGKSRRVVLSDTLLSNFTDEEIEVVVAHELGHYKHKDILKLLLIHTISIVFGFFLVSRFLQLALLKFGLSRIDDIAFFPIFAFGLMFFAFLLTPLLNAFSRYIEREADRFSLEKTRNPKAFINLMKKLGEMNLAEFQPTRFIELFLYDHPPIARRIQFAQRYQ